MGRCICAPLHHILCCVVLAAATMREEYLMVGDRCALSYEGRRPKDGLTLLREPALELIDDVSIPHKGQRIIVYPDIHPKLDVQPVALSDGREIGALPSDVQMPPAKHSLIMRHSCGSCEPASQGAGALLLWHR